MCVSSEILEEFNLTTLYNSGNNLESSLGLYFLNSYMSFGKVPKQLVDVNIASDYSKIGNMLRLCNGEKRLEIINKTISGEGLVSEITEKFNPEIGF